MSKICNKDCVHCKHLHFKFADAPHVIYMAYTCDVVDSHPLYDSLKQMAEDISERVEKEKRA